MAGAGTWHVACAGSHTNDSITGASRGIASPSSSNSSDSSKQPQQQPQRHPQNTCPRARCQELPSDALGLDPNNRKDVYNNLKTNELAQEVPVDLLYLHRKAAAARKRPDRQA